MRRAFPLFLLLALLLPRPAARAELVSFRVHTREPFAGGKAFGDTGAYEKVVGIATFALDPKHPRNRAIIDLDKAPLNADGKVEFRADFFLLVPKDPTKGNGALLYDVNNRGNKLALRFFNDAPGTNDPTTEAHAGNGFLFRKGYAVAWCGWIGELLPGDGRLLLEPPLVLERGVSPRGVVRYEMMTDKKVDSMPLSQRAGHGCYPPTRRGLARATLTWRMREADPRVPIPRSQWSVEVKTLAKAKKGVSATLPEVRLTVAGGFRPGYLYEFICTAERPIVQGTGFAGVRDLVSWLRHDTSKDNPLAPGGKPAITRAHAFGVSQSGRFLRHLLYQNFNIDEKDRIVFDGLIPHVAGGGLGSFNHRFAQPTRFSGQHEGHLYPVDVFPFTYGNEQDVYSQFGGRLITVTPRIDGILRRVSAEKKELQPRVMHTQSAAEYWHRSGSLAHTDTRALRDAKIPPNVRIYAFGGTQHGPASYPPKRGIAENLTNPADYRPFLRALLEALDGWVKDGTEPPPSLYPRLDRKTLVEWNQEATGFPALPGVRYPEVIQSPPVLDFGRDFLTRGIIDFEPPRLEGEYVVRVPRCNADGNDVGCLLPVEVAVPTATYTGWNLRRADVGAEARLAILMGSYIPFPRTKSEREKTGDPRASLEERYGDFGEYSKRWDAEVKDLIRLRYLLPEEEARLKKVRDRARDMFKKPGEGPARPGDK
jgi:hypothetical protein